ncbi:MAG: FAD:protein FMN transferase [Treponema sp.]|nr:FAD:protein FMN transferase [Treponema sp.]
MKRITKSLLTVFIVLPFLLTACSEKKSVTQTQKVLGTICTITVPEENAGVLEKVFNELYRIQSVFNFYDRNSLLSQINKNAGTNPVPVTDEFLYVIQTAQAASELTDGAFNPLVGPLVKLWDVNGQNPRIPAKEEIEEALRYNSWENVEINVSEKTVFLKNKGMEIDFGGIMKGYAADVINMILKKEGVSSATINLGGNVYVRGKSFKGGSWKIGIVEPVFDGTDAEGNPNSISESDRKKLIVKAKNQAVVTSGGYERFFELEGKRYHHIFDGRTGYPSESGLASATVVLKSSVMADCLSTAFFVLGKEKSCQVIDRLRKSDVKIKAVFIEDNAVVTVY